jgi:hypothetical protein
MDCAAEVRADEEAEVGADNDEEPCAMAKLLRLKKKGKTTKSFAR